MMRAIGNHLHAGIVRAVIDVIGNDEASRAKTLVVVEEIRSVEWSSATFVGARHEIDLRIEGDAAEVVAAFDRLASDLPDREIPLAGSIVAEISINKASGFEDSVRAETGYFTVNALTIID